MLYEVITGAVLRDGGLVAFSTETVYGLGADATNDKAVASIFAAKGRPTFNPLIVHVNSLEDAEKYVYVTETARKLAEKFSPGPLTMVLLRKENSGLSPLVSAGLDSVAIRIPNHQVAHDLIKSSNRPIAAPSANASGTVSPRITSYNVCYTKLLRYAGDDYYKLAVFSSLFGGGMSSRLFQEVREKRGLVYSVYSFSSSYDDSGVFGIYAGTGKEESKTLVPVVCDEIKKILDDGVSEDETKRAKAQLKASILMSMENSSARCERMAQQLMRNNFV